MRMLCLAAAAFLALAPAAHADTYQYAFSFTNLNGGFPDFTVTIDRTGLIDTTGLNSLGTSLPTPLGYSINNFGENASGFFAFSESGGTLTDSGAVFSDTTFYLTPGYASSDYDGVGTYTGGHIEGNLPYYPDNFSGDATLVITDLSTVTPEPYSFALLGTSLLGVAGVVRRRRA